MIPDYITTMLPETRRSDTGRTLRNANSHTLFPNSTFSFQRSFIPDVTRVWNKLPESIRLLPTLKSFKAALTQRMGLGKPPPFYTLGTLKGNRCHTQLILDMSPLNTHQFTIQKCLSPQCACGHYSENTLHFTLQCPQYHQHRTQLLSDISDILQHDFTTLHKHAQLDILLHGTDLSTSDGLRVAKAFQNFIIKTGRFQI